MHWRLNWRWLGLVLPLGLATALPGATTALAESTTGAPSPAATSTTPTAAPTPLSLDNWEAYLQSPTTPTRNHMFKGDDGNAPFLKTDAPAPTPTTPIAITTKPFTPPPANTPAPNNVSDDDRLAAIAVEDRDFFQALAKNPSTWPEVERDRRAQSIHDKYWIYLSLYPNDVNGTVLYGKLLNHTGQRDAAYTVFRRADALDPNLAVVKQQLANHLAEDGHYAAALEEFHQATALAPGEPIYHYETGELLNYFYNEFLVDKIFAEAGLNKTMEMEFARAAALAPQVPGFAWRHAECYYDMLDPDWNASLAAWDALEKTTTNATELEVIRLHRARVLIELGRYDEARKLLELSVRPGLEATRQTLTKRLETEATLKAAPAAPADTATPPTTP